MWTVMRIVGLMSLVGVVGAVALLIISIGVAIQHGINRENWTYFAIMGAGVLFGILKRKDLIWLLRYGLTGNKERLQ